MSLALSWMTVGCGTDNKTPQAGAVSIEVENGLDDTNQGGVPEDDLASNDEEIPLKDSDTVAEKPSNWYIRLIVEDPARALRSDSSQLGTLEVNGVVQDHTLKALNPFGSTYLSIVFIDPDGVEAGAYKTNYHAYQEDVEDSWRFTVKTDDPNAQISFTWHGLYVLTPYIDDQGRTRYTEYRSLSNPLSKQMKFIDTVNGQEVAAVVDGKVQTYSFNMDGQTERTFEWIVQDEEVDLPIQTAKRTTLQAKKNVEAVQKKASLFDLSKPPMIDQELLP